MPISQESLAPTVDLLQDLAVVCQDAGYWSTADRIQAEWLRLESLIRQPEPAEKE